MSADGDREFSRFKRYLADLRYRDRNGNMVSDVEGPPAVVTPLTNGLEGQGNGSATLTPTGGDDKARRRAMRLLREELALQRSEMARHRR